MTQKEWREIGEVECEKYARKISNNITIRTYKNGYSEDITRNALGQEAEVIFNICYAAILAYRCNDNSSLVSVLDCAEYMGILMFRDIFANCPCEVNCYDTIYIPLERLLGEEL